MFLMTPQFKKFIIGLFSLGFGILTFFILEVYAMPRNAELGGIAILLGYAGLSFGSVFIYYILLVQVLHNFIYKTVLEQESQNFKTPNILLENKFSILTVATVFLTSITGAYSFIFYGLIPVFVLLGLFKDKKIGKIIILTLLIICIIFYTVSYLKCINDPQCHFL